MKHFLRSYSLPSSLPRRLEQSLRKCTLFSRVVSYDEVVAELTDALMIIGHPTVGSSGAIHVDEFLLDVAMRSDDGTIGRPWVTLAVDAVTRTTLAVRVARSPASFGDIAEMLAPLPHPDDAAVIHAASCANARSISEVA